VHAVEWITENLLISGCEKGIISVTDARMSSIGHGDNCLWNLDLTSYGGIYSFSKPNNGVILSGHHNGNTAVIDIYARNIISVNKLHNEDVRSVLLWSGSSSSQSFALTTSFDTMGNIWKVSTKQSLQHQIFTKFKVLKGHSDKILCSAYSYSTGNIITTGADGNVIFWSPSLL
jgi:WD40 repeat protein